MPSPLLCDRPYDGDSLRYFRGFAVGALNTRTSAMDARYFRYNEDTGRFMENGDLYPPGKSSFSVELSPGFAHDRSGAASAAPGPRARTLQRGPRIQGGGGATPQLPEHLAQDGEPGGQRA